MRPELDADLIDVLIKILKSPHPQAERLRQLLKEICKRLLHPTQLRPTLAGLGIPGAHTDGRDVLCRRYSELLNKIHTDAGNAAVDAFLESKKG